MALRSAVWSCIATVNLVGGAPLKPRPERSCSIRRTPHRELSMHWEGEMSFSEWMQKGWYVFLVSVALGGALASVVADLFFHPLVRHSILVGAVLGWAATYVIYKAEYPRDE